MSEYEFVTKEEVERKLPTTNAELLAVIDRLLAERDAYREVVIDMINPDKGPQEAWAEKHADECASRLLTDKTHTGVGES